jgi:white-opaque regulator 2
MSNHPHQQGGQQRQQPVGYGHGAYSPPPMPPGQQYYVAATQAGDVYAPSPAGPPPNAGQTLPSMRSLDPLRQPPAPMPMPAPMPQGPGAMGYYAMPYAMHPGMPQYTLPLTDPRVALSGGRHKKVRVAPVVVGVTSWRLVETDGRVSRVQEIKRRTKTGCLTCRKRRIKVSTPRRFAASPGAP